jgi:isopenicillin N synthase-like dioxygenase
MALTDVPVIDIAPYRTDDTAAKHRVAAAVGQVPIVEDCFIVNIGDMMARWTNDRWVSTSQIRATSSGEHLRTQIMRTQTY